jgi:hypothetical protein
VVINKAMDGSDSTKIGFYSSQNGRKSMLIKTKFKKSEIDLLPIRAKSKGYIRID